MEHFAVKSHYRAKVGACACNSLGLKNEAYDEPGMLPREGQKSGKIWVQCDNTLAKDSAASQFSLPARLGIPPIRVFLGVFWGIDLRGRLAEHIGMSRWTISPARLFLLGFSLFVILLLVVLPEVDPLDTAFHRGTAPAVVHAKATSTPAILSLAVPFHFLQGAVPLGHSHEQPTVMVYSSPKFLRILHHSFRC